MGKQKKAVNKTAPEAESILQKVTAQLTTSLSLLKDQLGEEKFEKRIRKAAKKLTSGIDKKAAVIKKSIAKVKKTTPVKKKATKRTKPSVKAGKK